VHLEQIAQIVFVVAFFVANIRIFHVIDNIKVIMAAQREVFAFFQFLRFLSFCVFS